MGPDRIEADCGLGFACRVVDAHAPSAMKELEQQVIVPVQIADHHSCRPRNTLSSP